MIPRTCWVVIDDAAGFYSQGLGLAEALGFADPPVKRVRALRLPWNWLPCHPSLASLRALTPESDAIAPPWPDLVISCGRKAASIALAIRKAAGGSVKLVHVQRPQGPAGCFDAVVAPRHDRIAGPNVIAMRGATHRVTPQRLAAAAQEFAPLVQHLARPRVAVLVGGSNRYYQLSPEWAAEFGAALAAIAKASGCALMVTASRRTGESQIAALERELEGVNALIWKGEGANPYFGFLALADGIIATSDSVSMISEALAAKKPLLIAKLPGDSKRFEYFIQSLIEDGLARYFTGRFELFATPGEDEMPRVADAVKRRLGLRH